MKKICFLLVLFLCPFCVFAIDLASNAKSAISIEKTTGKIICEKNSNERLEPASMNKIMSLLMINKPSSYLKLLIMVAFP